MNIKQISMVMTENFYKHGDYIPIYIINTETYLYLYFFVVWYVKPDDALWYMEMRQMMLQMMY